MNRATCFHLRLPAAYTFTPSGHSAAFIPQMGIDKASIVSLLRTGHVLPPRGKPCNLSLPQRWEVIKFLNRIICFHGFTVQLSIEAVGDAQRVI